MIQLLYSHLLYDIEQQTHELAEARVKNNPELKASQQIDETNHLSDIAMRYCEEGVAMLNVILKRKLAAPSQAQPATSNDALVYGTTSWDFTLNDANLNERTLAILMHRFVVAYVLWQWAKLYAPDEAKNFFVMFQKAQADIEEVIYALGTPKKIDRCSHIDPQDPATVQVSWESDSGS